MLPVCIFESSTEQHKPAHSINSSSKTVCASNPVTHTPHGALGVCLQEGDSSCAVQLDVHEAICRTE